MSLLSDALLAGTNARLHLKTDSHNLHKPVRKSQGHGFLTPLAKLVRDPVHTLGNAIASPCDTTLHPVAEEVTNHKQILYLRLKNAESYAEWKAAATDLDILEGNNDWKQDDDSSEYNPSLVAARLQELDDARLSCDVKKMLFLIRTAMARELGGMGDLRLYKHSHIGTKKLIERYIDSAQQTMTALLDVSAKQGDQCPVEPQVLVEQMLAARQSFGRSALLLSGGGTFGMNHIGVVKSLWDAHLLPRIISGASAGSIVSAVLCTKTDEEVPELLEEFCYGDLDVFDTAEGSESIVRKVVRLCTTGSLFDMSHLTRVMRDMLGDLTFQEAYNRTRRILNIPVSTSSLYELPRLLNYITAPNVMIWSAVCTSCSVPLVYKTAQLMAKDLKTGKQVPWDADPDATWIDGSVDNDLPMTRLSEMFNVNHFIVSQVNPHVVPFLSKEEDVVAPEMQQGSALVAGSGWMANAASLARGEVLHRLQVLADIGIFPTYVTKLRGLLNQRYSGDINIFPAISYADFPKVLSNPTTEYMLGCLLTGQRATWPKLSRIQNHLAIELALDDTIQKLRARAVFSPSQADLRLGVFGRSNSQGNEHNQSSRTRSSSKTARLGLKTAPSSPLLRRSVPANPFVSRPTSTLPPSASTSRHQLPTKITAFQHRSAVDGALLDVISSSTNPEDSSDREYFAEIDSDTSEILSSPSPAISPLSTGPTLWPVSHESLFPCASQPVTPTISTSSDRRIGTLLNLSMTSATTPAAPSSPELRYKRLFHPPGPVAPAPPDEYPAQLHIESLSSVTPMTPFSERMAKSTPGSRRGSSVGLGGVLDLSGTRGMMRRVKGYKEAEAEAEAEAESMMME